jgi:hypothetical protein
MATLTKTTPNLTDKQRSQKKISEAKEILFVQDNSTSDAWDETLASPESHALILLMEAQLENDILNGLIENGGFGDGD